MKILVTGGCGFLGSHLVERLVGEGHEVLALDDCSVASRYFHPGVQYLHTDVAHCPTLAGVDRIYNLACPASPAAYQKVPLKTIDASVLGVRRLLDICKAGQARFLQASTSEVYGDPLDHPQRETDLGRVNTWGPRACYDEGKRLAETLCYEYSKLGVEVRVARIFNTYGPRMDPYDGRVVSTFIRQALKGEPLTIFGDGSQTRSLCYVDDTVEGLIRLMESDYVGPVNVGNPSEMTVEEIAEWVLIGTGNGIEHKNGWSRLEPLPQDDPKQRCPDISLAKKVLGWEPKVSLAEGLRKTIEWMRGELERRSELVYDSSTEGE